jgi:hypothetical protein
LKRRIEKLENQRRESQRGAVIISSSEWQAVWGDEADPNDEFVAEWREELSEKIVIVDDIRNTLQEQSGRAGAKPGEYSTGKQGNQ